MGHRSIDELESQVRAFGEWGSDGLGLVEQMIEMLTPDQVGKLTGLRMWQETMPINEQYTLLWDEYSSPEQVDEQLRTAGYDPEEIRENGRKLVRELMDQYKPVEEVTNE